MRLSLEERAARILELSHPSQLANYSRYELSLYRGIGRKSIERVQAYLLSIGVSLRNETRCPKCGHRSNR